MSTVKKWRQVLEERYGVQPEFAGHLLPLLECLATQQPTVAEWERMLHGVAAAYRTGRADEPLADSDEESVVLNDFLLELRKMDESLKVLSTFLERLRDRIRVARTSERLLH